MKNCYATGIVSGNQYIGGLIGSHSAMDIDILTNCYSTGSVSGSLNTGGLIGIINAGIFTSCYYNSTTSGQNDTGKGTGISSAAMKSQTSYTGWDFTGETLNGIDDIWTISSSLNNGYPYLQENQP